VVDQRRDGDFGQLIYRGPVLVNEAARALAAR
jgi:hypothetical protein